VFAALAVSRWIEAQTGWSIRKFIKTARRYAPSRSRPDGRHHRRRPPHDDLRQALDAIDCRN
jgi:hypothetical protein